MISCSDVIDRLEQEKMYPKLLRSSDARSGVLKDNPCSEETAFYLSGLCCSSEIPQVHAALKDRDGVEDVRIDVVTREVRVTHQEGVSPGIILEWLRTSQLGPRLVVHEPSQDPEVSKASKESNAATSRSDFPPIHVSVALFLWMLSLLHYLGSAPFLQHLEYAALGSVLLVGPQIARKAVLNLLNCNLNINILMLLASIGALALGQFAEAAAVLNLFSLSDWLSERASKYVQESFEALLDLAPDFATPVEGGKIRVEDVATGSRLAVRKGEKFPLDGQIVLGSTFVDESAFTGESLPVEKGLGDAVLAGTLNIGNYCEVRTTSLFKDSSVAQMIELIDNARLQAAPTQKIERGASIYTPIAFMIAFLLGSVPFAFGREVGWKYFEVALVVLVVAYPCALVISTPITYTCGLAAAAKRGILVKDGLHLELLGRLQTLFMDKTGTLSEGSFELVDVFVAPNLRIPANDLVLMAALAEQGSEHPVAKAFVSALGADVALDDFGLLLSLETFEGRGSRQVYSALFSQRCLRSNWVQCVVQRVLGSLKLW